MSSNPYSLVQKNFITIKGHKRIVLAKTWSKLEAFHMHIHTGPWKRRFICGWGLGPVSQRVAIASRTMDINRSSMANRVELAINRNPLWNGAQISLPNRPCALTSRLHNNDAMLGVKTCRAARTCCAGRAHWRSASQSVRGPGQPGGMACRGWPLAACLAMAHVAVPHLTPNTRGRPSVTSYAYGLLGLWVGIILTTGSEQPHHVNEQK